MHSVAGLYYSFPLLENNSKLSNIFYAGIIKSIDMKNFGNDSSLYIFVDEINFLENEGVLIKTRNGEFRVHFVLGIILGDNLGLNCVQDLSKSFSANYYCRLCKMSKNVAKNCFSLDSETPLCRNIDNYNNDVETNQIAITGIHQESILNNIKSFHVTHNFSVDIMHDTLKKFHG